MIETFETTEKLKGTIFIDGEELGTCRYEFTHNPFDTNSMKIVLFDPPGNIPRGPDSQSVKVVTRFHGGYYKMKLNTELAGTHLSLESRYNCPVKEFEKTQIFDENAVPRQISCGYLFPITSVTDSHVTATRHSSYGFIRGDYDRDGDTFHPRDNSFSIDTPVGSIDIGDEFYFQETDDRLYPQTHLIRRSRIGLEHCLQDKNLEDGLESVRNVVYDFFHFLSLIERTWVDWHTERYAIRSAEDKVITQSTRYRWVTKPHSKYRPNYNNLPESRDSLDKVLTAFWNCKNEKQVEIDEIIDNFKIANIVRTLQSKFIHWHSCLDFFKSIYFQNLPDKEKKRVHNMSFSMQLVYLFNMANIKVVDILKEDTINKIQEAINGTGKAPNLEFTELRNAYLHDGFHAFRDRLQEAQRLTEKMRALAERLLINYLDLEQDSTFLGEPKLL